MNLQIKEAIKKIQKLKQDRYNIIVHTGSALERRRAALMAYQKCIEILKEIDKQTNLT